MARGELRTTDIVADLLDKGSTLVMRKLTPGKALYTPYLPPSALTGEDNLMYMLRLYSPSDLAACPTDKWGILDPGTKRHDIEGAREDGVVPIPVELMTVMDPAAPPLDLILVPGVAFDAHCNRVGYHAPI